MSESHSVLTDPRMQHALTEIEDLIRKQYPHATFEVAEGEDPAGVHMTVTVDVADVDEVVDVFIDRLIELQVDEQLPIYVVPVRPLERVLQAMRHGQRPHTFNPTLV